MAPTHGQQLDEIMRDLDATTEAWASAGHPYEGSEFDAREAVFARLRRWNESVTNRFENWNKTP